jgi:hypothetical protein
MADLQNYFDPQILAEMAVGYKNNNHSATMVFGDVQTPNQSDHYIVFGDENTVLVPTNLESDLFSDVSEMEYAVSKEQFSCTWYAQAAFVPYSPDEQAQATYLSQAVNSLQDTMLNLRDYKAWTTLAACANTVSVTTKLDASTASIGTAIDLVESMSQAVEAATNARPDTLIVGRAVDAALRKLYVNKATTAAPSMPTRPEIAAALGINQIVVAAEQYKSATGGTLSRMWNTNYMGMVVSGANGDALANSWYPTKYGIFASFLTPQFESAPAPIIKGANSGFYVKMKSCFTFVEQFNKAGIYCTATG